MASTLTIQILSLPDAGDSFSVAAKLQPGGDIIHTITETFQVARTAPGEVKIGGNTQIAANSLRSAIILDFNTSQIYTVERVGSTVTVTSNNPYLYFEVVSNDNAAAVDITTVDDSEVPVTFDTLTAAEASVPCSSIQLTATLSVQADTINSPIAGPVANNPYIFETPRVVGPVTVNFSVGAAQVAKTVLIAPLLASYFDLETVVDETGEGTLSISTQSGVYSSPFYVSLVELEYSLDGVEWQSSAQFPGLALGAYTLYVRDNAGCSITIGFNVDEFNPNLVDYPAIAEISNINSLCFKPVEEWSLANPRHAYNTLSYEEDTELPNRYFKQLFQTDDTAIKTQVKTNYDTVEATLVDCEGTETALVVTKVTANMDKKDMRDGTVSLVGASGFSGQLFYGLRFGAGNTYDPETGAANGTYNLGESLPAWLNAGDYVNVTGYGWIKVTGSVYHNGYYWALLNLAPTQGSPFIFTAPVLSVYNVVDYERYEFNVVASGLLGDYYVRVTIQDTLFEELQFRSEWFNVAPEQPYTHRIDAYNTEANEINFSTGISMRLRVPYVLQLRWKPNSEQDIYITDTNTVPLENRYRAQWEFNARPLPARMAEKLVLLLLQDRLFIDGVSYVCEGQPESKTVGSQYQIKATLTKENYVFDSNAGSVGEITLGGGETLEIDGGAPGLLLID